MSARRQLTALFGAAAILLAAVGYLTFEPPVQVRVRPTRSARSGRSATAVTTPAVAPVTANTSITPRPRTGRIVVFGDSLMHEAHAFLVWDLASIGPIETHTYPMTAPCDFRTSIDEVLRDPPSVVILEFSGNSMTNCMRNTDGSFPTAPGLAARYAADAATVTERFAAAGTAVLWVEAPRGRPDPHRTDQFSGDEPFTASIYRAITNRFRALGFDVRFVAAAPAVLTDRGAWAPSLPCLPADTASGACNFGTASVRAPDGAHFCPSGITDPDGTCSVWSSGAWRYAAAIASSIRAAVKG